MLEVKYIQWICLIEIDILIRRKYGLDASTVNSWNHIPDSAIV